MTLLTRLFSSRKSWTIPYAIFAAVFVVLPLLLIVVFAFTDENGAFTLYNFSKFMSHPEAINTFVYSIGIAFANTLLCVLLGYPAAWILSQTHMRNASTVVMLFVLPMWVNILVRTLATVALFDFADIPLGEGALLFGMVYNFLPFMVLPIYNALEKIDKNVINAARDLGADGRITFLRVIFPLSLPGVISGVTMVFIPALTTFVVSSLLGGGKILLIGNVIEQEFMVAYDWNLGSGLSLVLLIFIIINVVISAVTEKGEEAKA